MYLRNHPVEGDSCLKQGFWRRLCLTASVNASLSLFHISKSNEMNQKGLTGEEMSLWTAVQRSVKKQDTLWQDSKWEMYLKWVKVDKLRNLQHAECYIHVDNWSTFCVYGLKIFVSLEKVQFYDVHYSSGPWIRSNSSLLYHCSVASSRRNLILHSHDNYNNNI